MGGFQNPMQDLEQQSQPRGSVSHWGRSRKSLGLEKNSCVESLSPTMLWADCSFPSRLKSFNSPLHYSLRPKPFNSSPSPLACIHPAFCHTMETHCEVTGLAGGSQIPQLGGSRIGFGFQNNPGSSGGLRMSGRDSVPVVFTNPSQLRDRRGEGGR